VSLYDPHSPQLQANLYDVYRRLRDDHPIYHNEQRRIWIVTRHEDVSTVLLDPETFSSAGVAESKLLMPMIVFMDDPRHKLRRKLLANVFTPARVADLEDGVRASVRELLDAAAEAGRCDFMRKVACQLPSIVICQLIGIPEERRETFIECTEKMIETGPNAHPIAEPAGKIYSEFEVLLGERRKERRDDLMSALLDAEVDGEGLNDDELLGFCFNLIIGGTDTTMNLLGNGTRLLWSHPDQRRMLADNLELIPAAIEEMLRIESPTQTLPRRPVRDVEMHGTTVPAESRLLVCFGAANHDERVFEDPDTFDFTKERERHLAFGLGAHHCLGAALARLEGRVAFEELLDRYPTYRIDGESQWITSRWARSHRELNIQLRDQ